MEFSPTAFEALVISVIAGFIVIGFSSIYHSFRKSQIKQDIEILELDKRHINAMCKSDKEVSRMGFRSIAALLGLLFFGLTIHQAVDIFYEGTLWHIMTFAIYFAGIILCIRVWKRYEDLSDVDSTNKRIDAKIASLQEKLK